MNINIRMLRMNPEEENHGRIRKKENDLKHFKIIMPEMTYCQLIER